MRYVMMIMRENVFIVYDEMNGSRKAEGKKWFPMWWWVLFVVECHDVSFYFLVVRRDEIRGWGGHIMRDEFDIMIQNGVKGHATWLWSDVSECSKTFPSPLLSKRRVNRTRETDSDVCDRCIWEMNLEFRKICGKWKDIRIGCMEWKGKRRMMVGSSDESISLSLWGFKIFQEVEVEERMSCQMVIRGPHGILEVSSLPLTSFWCSGFEFRSTGHPSSSFLKFSSKMRKKGGEDIFLFAPTPPPECPFIKQFSSAFIIFMPLLPSSYFECFLGALLSFLIVGFSFAQVTSSWVVCMEFLSFFLFLIIRRILFHLFFCVENLLCAIFMWSSFWLYFSLQFLIHLLRIRWGVLSGSDAGGITFHIIIISEVSCYHPEL